jgi:hypothetical protein
MKRFICFVSLVISFNCAAEAHMGGAFACAGGNLKIQLYTNNGAVSMLDQNNMGGLAAKDTDQSQAPVGFVAYTLNTNCQSPPPGFLGCLAPQIVRLQVSESLLESGLPGTLIVEGISQPLNCTPTIQPI